MLLLWPDSTSLFACTGFAYTAHFSAFCNLRKRKDLLLQVSFPLPFLPEMPPLALIAPALSTTHPGHEGGQQPILSGEFLSLSQEPWPLAIVGNRAFYFCSFFISLYPFLALPFYFFSPPRYRDVNQHMYTSIHIWRRACVSTRNLIKGGWIICLNDVRERQADFLPIERGKGWARPSPTPRHFLSEPFTIFFILSHSFSFFSLSHETDEYRHFSIFHVYSKRWQVSTFKHLFWDSGESISLAIYDINLIRVHRSTNTMQSWFFSLPQSWRQTGASKVG